MNILKIITVILFLISFLINLFSQTSDLYIPLNIKHAYTKKTRSFDGYPGPKYWQNRAAYKIHVNLDPKNGILTGTEEILYFNNSPDSLTELIIHLFPNIYKKGNSREFNIDFTDASEGVALEEIRVNNKIVDIEPEDCFIEYLHNDIKLNLEEPLHSGQTITLTISWHYRINRNSHMRTGMVDSSSYFNAYFFPRIAVYDDIDGWNYQKYSGIAEFYNDFGSFYVSITVPGNFIVWATGTLQNAEEVLTDKYYKRFQVAHTSDTIIHIIDSTECLLKTKTAANKNNIWKFRAKNVNDFAFAVSDHYLWDATSLVVDENTGRRVLIEAAYNKDSKDFYEVTKIARQSIQFMSYEFPGVPFPYPNETIFNGLDEMEYPMIVNNISVEDRSYLIKLTSHEISHSYFPFYMGINETKYGWMDEGWACFIEYQICAQLDSEENANIYYMNKYRLLQGNDLDMPMISTSIYLKRPVYHINSYAKPATFLFVLRNQLGDDVFKNTVHEYMRRWNGKHPTPYDFFYTINSINGEDLNWLFTPWFFEYGYVDLAIKNASLTEDFYEIIITKKGKYPAPIQLKITYDNESVEIVRESVSVWTDGGESCRIKRPLKGNIKSIELFDPIIPDADLTNNYFEF